MPIGGIVVSLVENNVQAQAALQYLGTQPDIELGPTSTDAYRAVTPTDSKSGCGWLERRVPAVLESASADTARDRIRELQTHPGIFLIDVVYVGFSEADEVPANPMERPRSRTQRELQG